MGESNDLKGLQCEKLTGSSNLSSWRNSVITGLGIKDLDTVVLEDIVDDSPEIKLKKKLATTFI